MKLKAPIATAVAIAVGVVVLLGYFFDSLLGLRQFLLQWAYVLGAVALLVGVFNLLAVHAKKINEEDSASAIYSALLILALVATFGLVLGMGPNYTWSAWVFENIQAPVEASLMAVLAISLSYAAARLLRRRANLFTMIFAATALLVLLGSGPLLLQYFPALQETLPSLRDWIAQVPAAGGARGILLGVALGAVATGLRILMGADRPYGG